MTSKSVTVLGRVGGIKVFDNTATGGNKVVSFGVAVDQRRPANQEDRQDNLPAVWTQFRAANGLAEMLTNNLTKGRLVLVRGSNPRIRTYEVERTMVVEIDGKSKTIKYKENQFVEEYWIDSFTFADSKKDKDSAKKGVIVGKVVDETSKQTPVQTDSDHNTTVASDGTVWNVNPEDIPF
jgi:single-stranded DNA-binding protein